MLWLICLKVKMGRVMGFEPTNAGTTIRSRNRLATPATYLILKLKSGRRGSNSRQLAWKANTLPTELHPHAILMYNKISLFTTILI